MGLFGTDLLEKSQQLVKDIVSLNKDIEESKDSEISELKDKLNEFEKYKKPLGKKVIVVLEAGSHMGNHCLILDYSDDVDDMFDGDVENYLDELGFENFQYMVTENPIIRHDDIYTYKIHYEQMFKHDWNELAPGGIDNEWNRFMEWSRKLRRRERS